MCICTCSSITFIASLASISPIPSAYTINSGNGKILQSYACKMLTRKVVIHNFLLA